ncbi:MAG: single-stranded DNA-binding protein [Thalassospira sp.]|uniref:single-stranded DNA-binding protein n=1 Tax=Thalassospira sp. TaxID=1912094 RepID=UPI003A841EB4
MTNRGINKVTLIGNLGGDPETRYTGAGKPVTQLSIATSDRWRDAQTGDLKERVEWHQVVMFDKLAEIAGEYLSKGSRVYIEGANRTSSWEQDGIKRFRTQVYANELQMLDGKPRNADASDEPVSESPPVAADMEDDIPF